MATLSDNMDERHNAALAKYHGRYNNDLYRKATAYMPRLDEPCSKRKINRAIRLQDSALAVCGDPYNAICPSSDGWTEAEQAFLALFV